MDLSTSSSNARLPDGPWRRTWLLTGLLVTSYLVFVLYAPLPQFEDPSSMENRVRQVELQSLVRNAHPKILVLGTSRAAFGVVPAVLDYELRLPARATVNAGYPSLGIGAFNYILDRNPTLGNVPLVFVFTDEYFLLQRTPSPAAVPKHLSPAENCELYLANLMSPAKDLHARMGWLRHHLEVHANIKPRSGLWMWNVDERGFWVSENLKGNELMQDPQRAQELISNISHAYYKYQEMSPYYITQLEALCGRLRSTGCRVVLLHMPTFPSYCQQVQQVYGALYHQHRRELTALAERAGVPCYFMENADCGLKAEDYADPVHLTHAGAERFTHFLAHFIQQEGLLNGREQGSFVTHGEPF